MTVFVPNSANAALAFSFTTDENRKASASGQQNHKQTTLNVSCNGYKIDEDIINMLKTYWEIMFVCNVHF